MSGTSLVALLFALGTPQANAEKLFAAAKGAVVQVIAGKSTGTGFAVGNGATIITCWHVVKSSSSGVLVDGKTASVRAYDETADVAVLTVSKPLPKPLKLNTSLPSPGAKVFVIGNPLGYLSKSISEGIISGVRREDDIPLLQMTAPISHGSSGSPVLNSAGQVVGMASSYVAEGQSLNFAVASSEIARCIAGKGRAPVTALTPSGAKWIMLKEVEATSDTLIYSSKSAQSDSASIAVGESAYQVGPPVGNWLQVYTEGNSRSFVMKDKFKPTGWNLRVDPSDDFMEYIESKAFVGQIKQLVRDFLDPEKQKSAGPKLREEGFRAVCVLARLLPQSKVDSYDYPTSKALASFGTESQPVLARLLKSKDFRDRVGAAATICLMTHDLEDAELGTYDAGASEERKKAQDAEWAASKDAYGFVREASFSSRMVSLLADPNEEVRAEVAEAIGPLRLPDAKKPLTAMMVDRDADAALNAVKALLYFGDPESAYRVQLALERICTLMAEDDEEKTVYIVPTMSNGAERISSISEIPGDFVVAQAVEMLDSSKEELRAAGARVLRDRGTKEHLARLEPLLKDASPMVRRSTIEALATFDSTIYFKNVQELAASKEAADRVSAVTVLPFMAQAEAAELLISLASDEEEYVRDEAFWGLGYRTEPKVEEFLRNLVKSEKPDVRKAAREALDRFLESVANAKKKANDNSSGLS